jgi:hypothetical protein
MNSFSPLELGILLHYHSSPEDMWWCVEGTAPIRDQTMAGLVNQGLLERILNGGFGDPPLRHFRPTPKLHAFVNLLCKTPLPVQKWVDPRTDEIVNRP